MSKINENNSNNNDGKSSKIIIISKSRVSSAKDVPNYMTVFDGNKKITCELGQEKIQKSKLKKVFSTLKEKIIKYSKSSEKLNLESQKIKIYNKRNKLNISANSEKNNNNQQHYLKTIETNNGLITIENNDKNKSSENENKNDKNNSDEDDSLDLKNLKVINIEQIFNDNNINKINNSRNLISQNYFNNIKKSKDQDEFPFNIYKSDEMKKTMKHSDIAVKSVSDHISKINENIQMINSEKSSNKKSITIKLNINKPKKDFINTLITEERKLTSEKEEEENYEKIIHNQLDTERLNKIIFANQNLIKEEEYYHRCAICEYSSLESKMFLPECKIHHLCKRCTKNYYEEKIDDGIKKLFCPFFQCKKEINLDKLRHFISIKHYNRLNINIRDSYNSAENKLIFSRLKTDYNKENVELYSKRHVIDINTNKDLYNYRGEEKGFCPFCSEQALFTQTNNIFYKCLNCLTKICKYCFKEYNNRHLDSNYPGRCKIFYRNKDITLIKQGGFVKFFSELFFVIALYYLTFVGIFLLLRDYFYSIFNISKKKNICKYFFSYCFTIFIFLILFPFIIIIFPYFPSISAMFDY